MQTVFAICGNELDKLAVTANKIHDITAPTVCSLKVVPVAASIPLAIATTSSMENQISEIAKTFKHLISQRRRSSHVDAEDRVAIHDQDRSHQALDIVGIINASWPRS